MKDASSSAVVQVRGDASGPPELRVASLDPEGVALTQLEPLAAAGSVLDRAVAAFGDGFAVAGLDALDPSTPNVVVRLYDAPSELPAAVRLFSPPADEWPGSELALLGNVERGRLLVAWHTAGGGGRSRVLTRRLTCHVSNQPESG